MKPPLPPRLLPLLLLLLPLLPAPTLSLAIALAPPPPTAGRDLECFNLTTPKAYPVDLADCPSALELLYHDPSGVMTLQPFSHDPSTFQVPHAWQFGACQVLLTSGRESASDRFRLADVIVKAVRIIEDCPPMSKRALGGIALVGHGQTFFVAVNGPDLAPDGGGGGGEGDLVGGGGVG